MLAGRFASGFWVSWPFVRAVTFTVGRLPHSSTNTYVVKAVYNDGSDLSIDSDVVSAVAP